MSIDWSKAPEGAEAARDCMGGQVEFYRTHEGQFCFWSKSKHRWVEALTQPNDTRLVWKPFAEQSLAWSGEGPPPVGTVCRLKSLEGPFGEGAWGIAEILYSTKQAIVWRWQGHAVFEFGANFGDVKCEPIRTPEQIAAEERECEIEELVEFLRSVPWDTARLVAQHLHDAGYRKTEGGAA